MHRKTKKSRFLVNYWPFIVSFLLLVVASFFPSPKVNDIKLAKNIISPSPSSKPSPTAIPIPTATPTPTPEPTPAGFCLDVPILMYHHVQPTGEAADHGETALTVDNGFFDSQMAYLAAQGYTTYRVEDLANALSSHQSLAGKSVVVTLDDGYVDNYTYAFPVAKKYNIKLNIMLITGLMDNGRYLSWDNVKEMAGSGLVSFYDHTWSHFSLPTGSAEKMITEIMTAQKQIEDHTGQTYRVIAYPYGSFDNNVIAVANSNGFHAGLSTISGWRQCDSIIMGLHRNRVGNAPLSAYGL